jgi:hypothetical protein
MTALWVAIVGVALASAAIKAMGPILVGAKNFLRAPTRSSPCWHPLSLRPWWSPRPSARMAISCSTRGQLG